MFLVLLVLLSISAVEVASKPGLLARRNNQVNQDSDCEFPCKNGGYRVTIGDDFKCLCPKDFYGKTCEMTANDRVMARWTNNKYYAGKIAYVSAKFQNIGILFDDGDKITHPLKDVTAVFANKVPEVLAFKDHVIAPWKGSYTRYIGFVIAVSGSQGYKVRFDDNDEDWYKRDELRIFPDASSPHDVGARVFARWTNGLYYRGFVSNADVSTVSVKYDDADHITLNKDDDDAVILDKLPQEDQVMATEVIGYWPARVRYYPGRITKFCGDGLKFYLKFNDGDERCEAIYEIRTVPESRSKSSGL